eukprot:scaffold134130_cov31-Tisochrysis_lutea.AAC.2
MDTLASWNAPAASSRAISSRSKLIRQCETSRMWLRHASTPPNTRLQQRHTAWVVERAQPRTTRSHARRTDSRTCLPPTPPLDHPSPSPPPTQTPGHSPTRRLTLPRLPTRATPAAPCRAPAPAGQRAARASRLRALQPHSSCQPRRRARVHPSGRAAKPGWRRRSSAGAPRPGQMGRLQRIHTPPPPLPAPRPPCSPHRSSFRSPAHLPAQRARLRWQRLAARPLPPPFPPRPPHAPTPAGPRVPAWRR